MENPTESDRPGADPQGLRDHVLVVLYGGRSMEREVSLETGQAIVDAFGVQARQSFGLAGMIPVEVAEDGRWNINGSLVQPWLALESLPAKALFFLGLHGGEGEDGTLQGFLGIAGKPYTGSGVAASALCMDKYRARLAFEGAGLRTAPCVYVQSELWGARRAGYLDMIRDSVGAPYYVKPNAGGSSVLTGKVTSLADLETSIDRIVAAGGDVLIEESVTGLEVTCAILGNRKTGLTTLPVVEIVPEAGRFFDYEQKYSNDGAIEHCPPKYLSEEASALVQERSLQAYRATGCDGYARVDFIMPTEGVRGTEEPVILEINTLPGFTKRSLLPMAARVEGISFVQLCAHIAGFGLTRA